MTAWVHRCPWCEWAREADSATIVEPRCRNCGGLLEAVAATAAHTEHGSPFRVSPPQVSPAFGRILRFALVGLLLVAAARFGWSSGGAGLALVAVGVVGLFTVPLIVGE